MAAGGDAVGLIAGQDSVISLFNNASDGSSLYVYSIAILSGAGNLGFWYQLPGPGTTLLGPCFPIKSSNPMPWGQIWVEHVPNATQVPETAPFIPLGFAAQPPTAGGPMAIVDPGYRLCTQASGDIATTFVFAQLKY